MFKFISPDHFLHTRTLNKYLIITKKLTMKKLLLANFIMFGCVSFAAAQSVDAVNPSAAKTQPVPVKTNKSQKQIDYDHKVTALQAARGVKHGTSKAGSTSTSASTSTTASTSSTGVLTKVKQQQAKVVTKPTAADALTGTRKN